MEISKFFVGREKKGQAVFLPLVLLRGREDVAQNWNGRLHKRAGEACPLVEDCSGRVVRLPQEGKEYRWQIFSL